MKRLCALGVLLILGVGCATEADKAQWDEAMKDLRGDNMKMRTGNWGRADSDDDMMPDMTKSSHYRSGLN
jgi:hypothetical protein